MVKSDKPAVLQIRPAGNEHQVVTVSGGSGAYRRKPCADCPWRKDATGKFPPEAFRHSANTAYDMSDHIFGCHRSGTGKPATCAGFLLRGANHNLAVRLGYPSGYALLEGAVCSLDGHPEEFLPELRVSSGNPRRWIDVDPLGLNEPLSAEALALVDEVCGAGTA